MRLAFSLLLAIACVESVFAADWPQWLGPNRDSVWREDGIVERFPSGGLKVKWRVPVALGYSGPAVAGGKVYVSDYVLKSGDISNNPGGKVKLEGTERLLCFDASTGKPLWKHEYNQPYNISYPSGPRCTPTVDSGRVYSLGAEGKLFCLDADSGDLVWSKDFAKEYNAPTPHWGHSAHPLVDERFVYCIVGGKGSVAVAFDKNTGEEAWRAISAATQGYCPPTMIEHGGARQLLIWDPEKLTSLDPATGKAYWAQPLVPSYEMSVTAPRQLGNSLFVSGIGSVGALFALDQTKPAAEVAWRGKPKTAVYSCNSTPFLEDGVIYGNDCQTGKLIAAQVADGERLWETYDATGGGSSRISHGTAFIVKHKDRFFLFNEKGDLLLARLSRAGYEELGRFHVLEPTNEAFGRPVVWTHPAFAEKCVFARNDKELVCVSLAE